MSEQRVSIGQWVQQDGSLHKVASVTCNDATENIVYYCGSEMTRKVSDANALPTPTLIVPDGYTPSQGDTAFCQSCAHRFWSIASRKESETRQQSTSNTPPLSADEWIEVEGKYHRVRSLLPSTAMTDDVQFYCGNGVTLSAVSSVILSLYKRLPHYQQPDNRFCQNCVKAVMERPMPVPVSATPVLHLSRLSPTLEEIRAWEGDSERMPVDVDESITTELMHQLHMDWLRGNQPDPSNPGHKFSSAEYAHGFVAHLIRWLVAARAENCSLRDELHNEKYMFADTLSDFWGLLYPDTPQGYEYRTQPLVHIRTALLARTQAIEQLAVSNEQYFRQLKHTKAEVELLQKQVHDLETVQDDNESEWRERSQETYKRFREAQELLNVSGAGYVVQYKEESVWFREEPLWIDLEVFSTPTEARERAKTFSIEHGAWKIRVLSRMISATLTIPPGDNPIAHIEGKPGNEADDGGM